MRLSSVANKTEIASRSCSSERVLVVSGNALNREILIDQGHDVRYLGAAEGLAADVPKDASLLLVIGPQKAFSAEETASINRFMDKGGKMLMALDPEAGLDFKDILTPFALKVKSISIGPARAGKPFTARALVMRSDFDVPVTEGNIGCAAKLAGRNYPGKAKFAGDRVACTWRLPKQARGKRFVGSVSVTLEGVLAKRSFSVRVK